MGGWLHEVMAELYKGWPGRWDEYGEECNRFSVKIFTV